MKQLSDTAFLENQVFGEEETEGLREEEEEIPVELTLTLEDGRILNCRVAGVFIEEEKEYIALETEGEPDEETGEPQGGMIYIMGLSQGEEDAIELRPLEDEEEQEAAFAAFFRMVEEEDYAAQAEMENRLETESEIKDDRD